MPALQMSTFTREELEEIFNKVKDFMIAFLNKEGAISDENAEKYHYNYMILQRRPGFFSRVFKKGTENTYRLYMVENKTPDEENTDDPQKA